jgi:hypothetical protein
VVNIPSHSPKITFNERPQILNQQANINNQIQQVAMQNKKSLTHTHEQLNLNKSTNKEKDPYNYPFQPSKIKTISSTSKPSNFINIPPIKSNLKTNNSKHSRQSSLDSNIDKKTKCIEYMESHIKNYFDQVNSKNEAKDNNEPNNAFWDKSNMINSKESLNTSNISNVFEKNSPIKRDYKKDHFSERNNMNDYNPLLQQTPQFVEDQRIILGYVLEDFHKTRVKIFYNIGWRVIM